MKALFVFIYVLFCVPFIYAQEYKIAAKVNEKIITLREVMIRAELMQTASRLNASETIQKQFKDQALKDLIAEQIQFQEVERLGFTAPSEKMDELLKQISSKFGDINPEKKHGFLESLRGQLKGQLAWPNIIRQRFGASVVVTDSEIEEMHQEMIYKKSQKQYLVSEILFPFQKDNQSEILKQAQEVLSQVRQGVPFSIVAEHVSKGPTAKMGGDLGWIVLDQKNNSTLEKTIPVLKVGETSEPIETPEGYVIYRLRDIKAPGVYSLDETYYSYDQVSISDKLSDESLHIHVSALMETKTCQEFQNQVKENPDILFKRNENIKGSSLPPILQDWFRDLKEGEKTKPVKTQQEGILIFMICKKSFKEDEITSKEKIKNQLEEKRLSLFSSQYLKSLKENATIETMD